MHVCKFAPFLTRLCAPNTDLQRVSLVSLVSVYCQRRSADGNTSFQNSHAYAGSSRLLMLFYIYKQQYQYHSILG